MKIEVLGTGCYNCVKLESLIDEVLQELGKTDVEVARVDEEKRIRHYISVDQFPGLLIDGVLASTRGLPSRETLVEWLSGVSMPDARQRGVHLAIICCVRKPARILQAMSHPVRLQILEILAQGPTCVRPDQSNAAASGIYLATPHVAPSDWHGQEYAPGSEHSV